jgi:acetyl/propionyl-CoA carboxylase alpha subunit
MQHLRYFAAKMSKRPAQNDSQTLNRPRRKALVLGERSTACIIARQLEAEGFEPVFQDQFLEDRKLPSLADPNSLRRIRRLLKDFASFSKHAGTRGVVHPGVTAWAERSEFPIIAEELGLTAVCPPAKVLSLFSNKLNLLIEAKKLGVPNAVLGFDPIHTIREIEDFIRKTQQKLPFVLKAVKGRGSTSLFVAKEEETLKNDLLLWFEQLRRNVGEVILFAEKYVDGARHLVVPFCRFQDGRIWTFPLSDISLQCRYRKVIEFCPARQVKPEITRQLIDWTHHLAEEFGYVGVGAFEFLVDGSSAYLIEGLARLNAGFHLWESMAKTDAVAWQIAALDFHKPPVLPAFQQFNDVSDNFGFGISVRIYAEDPLYHLPQPGFIHEIAPMSEPIRNLSWPKNYKKEKVASDVSAIDISSALSTKDVSAEYSLNYGSQETVSTFDSGIIGLFFAYGSKRADVLSLIRKMVSDFWIVGTLQTNQRFLWELLNHPWIEEEIFYAGFIDDEYIPDIHTAEEMKKLFLGVSSYLSEITKTEPTTRWFIGERRIKTDADSIEQAKASLIWSESPVYWDVEGRTAFSGVLKLSDKGAWVGPKAIASDVLRVCVYPTGDHWLVRIGFWFNTLKKIPEKKDKKGSVLKALNSGRIHAVLYLKGAIVPAHEPLLTLEAFGVLVPHALPVEARIVKWYVTAEDSVQEGQELAQLMGV